MKAIEAAGERIARRARDNLLRRLEAAAHETLPRDLRIERNDDELRLAGKRLSSRSATDPRLQALGMLAKEGKG